jgi:hypothetical protein
MRSNYCKEVTGYLGVEINSRACWPISVSAAVGGGDIIIISCVADATVETMLRGGAADRAHLGEEMKVAVVHQPLRPVRGIVDR